MGVQQWGYPNPHVVIGVQHWGYPNPNTQGWAQENITRYNKVKHKVWGSGKKKLCRENNVVWQYCGVHPLQHTAQQRTAEGQILLCCRAQT